VSTKHLVRWKIVRTGGTWDRSSSSVAASVWRVFVNISISTQAARWRGTNSGSNPAHGDAKRKGAATRCAEVFALPFMAPRAHCGFPVPYSNALERRGTAIEAAGYQLRFHRCQALSLFQFLMELFWLRRWTVDARSSPIRGERLPIETALDKIFQ
jgi:hypothetical protein